MADRTMILRNQAGHSSRSRKVRKSRHARRNASWTASSASDGERTMDRARRYAAGVSACTNAANAEASPERAARTRSPAMVVILPPGRTGRFIRPVAHLLWRGRSAIRSRMVDQLPLLRHDPVPHPRLGHDEFGRGAGRIRGGELASETGDVDVEVVRLLGIGRAPNGAQDPTGRDHAAGLTQQ